MSGEFVFHTKKKAQHPLGSVALSWRAVQAPEVCPTNQTMAGMRLEYVPLAKRKIERV
jgi:hypothetical protein